MTIHYNARVEDDFNYRLEVIKNMKTHGGSFVQALAECFVRADHPNLVKLIRHFSEYVDEYLPEKWDKT